MITTAQIRGARGILGWSQGDLADRTDISATSIGSIENGITQARTSTLEIIQRTFEDAGIEFLASDGIRKKANEISFFKGKQGFLDFYDDIYKTALSSNKDESFLVSNVDEKEFLKWGSEIFEAHSQRINSLEKVHYKILVKSGDMNFAASKYAQYKWLPEEFFSSVPFYVYCDKLAIILFEDEPTVMVLDYPMITQAYRKQFEAMWAISQLPEKIGGWYGR